MTVLPSPENPMFTTKSREIATWLGVVGTLSLLMGCTGLLNGGSDGTGTLGPGNTIGNNTTGGSNGVGGNGVGVGGNAVTAGAGGGGPVVQGTDPGTKPMHRLNDAEYNNSIQDALGVTQAPADWSTGQGVLYGFDNIAALLGMDTKTYTSFFNAASKVADEVLSTAALKSAFIACTAADAACQQTVIAAAGLKLFRRPLAADELTTYGKVYTAAAGLGETPENSLKHVLRAMLSSAEFLYRIETDGARDSLTPHKLNPYELASRVSYFLWSSGPDQALLDSAANGKLLDDQELGSQVERLLADGKGARFVTNFAGQWLSIRDLSAHAVDKTVFPNWTPAITAAEMEEAYRYFNEFARGAQPWSSFLKADFNFVNADLAKLYGMPAPAGAGLQLVQVKDDHRYGFLGLGQFLTVSSYQHRTAPTLRARRILDQLMCSPPLPPPAGTIIPPLDGDSGTAEAAAQNIRQRLEMHRKNPICAACHSTFDAVGMALENFDAIGQYRATYPNGSAVDASGVIAGGQPFVGLDGLTDMLTADPKFSQCVADKLFIYSLGRGIEDTDRPYIDNLTNAWKSGTAVLPTLIKNLVLADTFRSRRGEAQ
jgi:Protein of unknown function (DUF1592)/Protein of unknown function (DUF1588)/Protein of unknown function (DUF1595)/Protein of unknown function (DUF1585)/Protein of unknown function (DUF1587)